jgi:hypothetical protein
MSLYCATKAPCMFREFGGLHPWVWKKIGKRAESLAEMKRCSPHG